MLFNTRLYRVNGDFQSSIDSFKLKVRKHWGNWVVFCRFSQKVAEGRLLFTYWLKTIPRRLSNSERQNTVQLTG